MAKLSKHMGPALFQLLLFREVRARLQQRRATAQVPKRDTRSRSNAHKSNSLRQPRCVEVNSRELITGDDRGATEALKRCDS